MVHRGDRASCYTGKLIQSKYLARWCIDGVANV